MRLPVLALLLALLLTITIPLPAQEPAILAAVDQQAPSALALLETLVNQNSGTFHPAGVRAMAELTRQEFNALGFTTRLVEMDAVQRGPHLIAEHKGNGGKPVLLIGHLDTVFEPASPFQKFERKGPGATGPGVADMKGGIVVLLTALRALHTTGQLAPLPLTVMLTGDEEEPGRRPDLPNHSRLEMVRLAKLSRAALSFEGGIKGLGFDYATTARRGYLGWEVRSTGKPGHSGQVFTESSGYGAIYEISRVISTFEQTLKEPNLTFNVGLLLGGGDVKADVDGKATADGKPNIIAAQALARGEVRALEPAQVSRIKDRMYAIVAKSLPGAHSEIKFVDGAPPMPPTPGNRRLLKLYDQASRAANLGPIEELDPMQRGAGDISYIAAYVDCLDGLGAVGAGTHAVGESVELDSLTKQAKRAALLLYRLGR